MIRRYVQVTTTCLLMVGANSSASAGQGAVFPKYHPAPCSGDDCKADDPRSGISCQGFLCGFSSARAMQRPTTAAEAAEAARARAAALEAAAAAASVPPPPAVMVNGKHRHVVSVKARTALPTPLANPTQPTADLK